MRYMLLIYQAPEDMDAAPDGTCDTQCQESIALAAELRAKGCLVGTDALSEVSTARTVRHRRGEYLTTDGPFAETREHLAGYFLVEAAGMDEALALARRLPQTRTGSVEVRPIFEIPGLH